MDGLHQGADSWKKKTYRRHKVASGPVLGAFLVPLAVPFVLLPTVVGVGAEEFLAGMWEALWEDTVDLVLLSGGTAALLGAVPFQLRYLRAARLLLGPAGIRFRSGFGARLGGHLERR